MYDYTDFSLNLKILDYLNKKINLHESILQELHNDINLFNKKKISKYLQYYAPYQSEDIERSSVDIALSLSTMEHVREPEKLYNMLSQWLTKGGILINKIDFSSHGMTKTWFGHFILSKYIWALIQGRKPTYLNKWTEKKHIECCEIYGFKLLKRIEYHNPVKAPHPILEHPSVALHVWENTN